MTTPARTLAGVTVVSLEHAVAVPFATRQLADLGARVIKIERPGVGDFARGYDRAVRGQSSYFVWLNRGKESLELDIKHPEDRAVLGKLVDRADVFVSNLGPGAVERLALDASTLRKARPELIHCTVSGYGSTGPYASKKAYDLLVQCEAGLLAVTGVADEPAKAGFSVADVAAGMYTFSGILAALLERVSTGDGATLEVAMIDALGEWMSQPAIHAHYSGLESVRTGARHPTIAPYGPYICGDGSSVFVAIQNDREWAQFCTDVLGRPELGGDHRFATNSDRVAHSAALDRLITRALSQLSSGDAVALLEGARIACARMHSPGDLLTHPALTARNRWGDVTTPTGIVQGLRPPVSVAGRDEIGLGAIPALGEHNEAIRRELTTVPPTSRSIDRTTTHPEGLEQGGE